MFEFNWKKNKTVYRNLLEIKGISDTTAAKICGFLGISFKTKYSDIAHHKLDILNLLLSIYLKKTNPFSLNSLSDFDPLFNSYSCPKQISPAGSPIPLSEKKQKLAITPMQHMPILHSLETWIKENKLTLIQENTYKGRRHKLGYPVHGQRTRTNAKTAKRLNRMSH